MISWQDSATCWRTMDHRSRLRSGAPLGFKAEKAGGQRVQHPWRSHGCPSRGPACFTEAALVFLLCAFPDTAKPRPQQLTQLCLLPPHSCFDLSAVHPRSSRAPTGAAGPGSEGGTGSCLERSSAHTLHASRCSWGDSGSRAAGPES